MIRMVKMSIAIIGMIGLLGVQEVLALSLKPGLYADENGAKMVVKLSSPYVEGSYSHHDELMHWYLTDYDGQNPKLSYHFVHGCATTATCPKGVSATGTVTFEKEGENVAKLIIHGGNGVEKTHVYTLVR